MLSVKVIFSQRGINFLSQAAHSGCGTACVAHKDPLSVQLLWLFTFKTCLSHENSEKAIKCNLVLYITWSEIYIWIYSMVKIQYYGQLYCCFIDLEWEEMCVKGLFIILFPMVLYVN